MAHISKTDPKIKWLLHDSAGIPFFGVMMMEEGTASAYPCLIISDADTTFYFWPSVTAGTLRFGTTAPSTRASDGGLVSG